MLDDELFFDFILGEFRLRDKTQTIEQTINYGGGAGSGGGGESLWEVNTYLTYDFLQPKDTTQGLVIGNDVDSSVTTAFAGASALFNGDVAGSNNGQNYFLNLAYGTSYAGFGGMFTGGHANGTPSAPTQTLASNWLGGVFFAGFDGTDWAFSTSDHSLTGLWSIATSDVASGVKEEKFYFGGLVTPMIALDTSDNSIKLNESLFDSDITFYNDTGTTMTMDGTTGLITVGNSISLPSGQGIDWGGTNNDVYANTGTGVVTVRGVNGVNARVGSTDIIATTSTGADITGVLGISDGSAAAPSLAFTSDPDTGIHRVGANQMSFDTNGLARVQISATSTVVNPANLATGDFQVHGDTVNNIIFTDASADALGFFNATPVAQSTGWSVTNETTDKSFDANATSIDELADVLGTLIETLKSYGILGA